MANPLINSGDAVLVVYTPIAVMDDLVDESQRTLRSSYLLFVAMVLEPLLSK